MIAVQALEKRTAELKQKEAQIAVLESRLEALELRQNQSIQITAEKVGHGIRGLSANQQLVVQQTDKRGECQWARTEF